MDNSDRVVFRTLILFNGQIKLDPVELWCIKSNLIFTSLALCWYWWGGEGNHWTCLIMMHIPRLPTRRQFWSKQMIYGITMWLWWRRWKWQERPRRWICQWQNSWTSDTFLIGGSCSIWFYNPIIIFLLLNIIFIIIKTSW